jgi:hypothetical protein
MRHFFLNQYRGLIDDMKRLLNNHQHGPWCEHSKKFKRNPTEVIVPVRIDTDIAVALLSPSGVSLCIQTMGLEKQEDGTFEITAQTLDEDTSSLLDIKFVQSVLLAAYDLLHVCEAHEEGLPMDVHDAAWKFAEEVKKARAV